MKKKKNPKNIKRGRRNRQRGAELQRQVVRSAKDYKLSAYNRDRGGAQHEKGDVEIEGKYYGCKRRKSIVIRGDRDEPFMVVPLEQYLLLLSLVKKTL